MTNAMLAVMTALTGKRFPLEDEKVTQLAIWSAFEAIPSSFVRAREVRITGGIIDFMVGDCGVEIKIHGCQPAGVVRQLKAYAAEPSIAGIVLVSARPVALGPSIGGKPLATLDLGRAWL